MFDFRYHALSLVAVFLALMIGLLLGVAIGDKGLVSSAEHNLRASLRSDVRAAQAESANLRTQLADQKRFQDAVYPLLVQGRLSGQRIGRVGRGGLPDGTIREVRDALQGTGGQFAGVAVVREPVSDSAVQQVPGASSPPTSADYGKLGNLLAAGLLKGGKQANALTRGTLQSSSGNLRGVEGLVIYRAPLPGGAADANVTAFDAGLVSGLAANARRAARPLRRAPGAGQLPGSATRVPGRDDRGGRGRPGAGAALDPGRAAGRRRLPPRPADGRDLRDRGGVPGAAGRRAGGGAPR